MIFSLQGARTVRVSFKGFSNSWTNINDGRCEVGFPIEDSQASIPYQIQATTDDWQEVASWTPNNPSKNFSLEEQKNAFPVNDQAKSTISISATNFPSNDPEDLGEDFKIVCEPSDDRSSGWSTLHKKDNHFIFDSYLGKLADLKKVSVQRRTYHNVNSGILAFGAKGDEHNIVQPNHQVRLVSVRQPTGYPKDSGEQWTPEGKKEPFQYYNGGYIDMGSKVPGVPMEGFRFLVLGLLVGEFEPEATLRTKPPFAHSGISFGYTGQIVNGMKEAFLGIGSVNPPDLCNFDVSLGVGVFTEIARSFTPTYLSPGNEPEGTYVVQDYVSKYHNEQTISRSCFIRIPKGHEDSEFRVSWIDSQGTEHSEGMMTDSKTHAGVQVNAKIMNKLGLAGIVLRARKLKRFQFNDVHLRPLTFSLPPIKQ